MLVPVNWFWTNNNNSSEVTLVDCGVGVRVQANEKLFPAPEMVPHQGDPADPLDVVPH